MLPNHSGIGPTVGESVLFRVLIPGLLLALLCGGCGDPHRARSPEETLAIAAAGLAGVDKYDFNVRTGLGYRQAKPYFIEEYEGRVIGHAKPTIRRASKGGESALSADRQQLGSPAERLAAVQKLAQSVEYADSAEKGPNLSLSILLRPDAAAQAEAAFLRAAFERSAEAVSPETIGSGNGKADQRLRQAVREEIADSRRKLEAMLRTLEVEDRVYLTVDRSRMLPVRMEETVVMRYVSEGKKRVEKRVSTVTIGGFDGKPAAIRAAGRKS